MSTADDKLLDEAKQMMQDVSQMFEKCLQEIYKGSYPDITFTVYVTYPKYIDVGHAQSMIHLRVASDLADEVGLKNKVINARTPVIDCMNDKLSVYRKSQPNNQIYAFVEHAGTPINPPQNVFDLDKSQFLETIESSLRNNWYGRIIVKSGQAGKIVFYTTGILNNITGENIIELIKCVCSRYEESSLKRFLDEQGEQLIKLVKDIIDKLP